ncbi:hypothetical protein PTMSG1_09713 [Pyrenophora teres f. maculata]|nr:hypothetical protein PTMSG1_09713 [Pyrenophora teres f. maculata]
MTSNNTYDRSRDPRLMRQPSNIQMTDTPSTDNFRTEAAMPSYPSSPSNIEPVASGMVPEEPMAQLLARIAQLETDKVELHKATVTAKEEAKSADQYFQDTNLALANYQVLYAKGIYEKNELMKENTNKERAQLALNEQIAGYAHQVSDMTNKANEMEKRNGELQERIVQLEREKASMQRRVDELEAVREQRSVGGDVGDVRIRQESYTPHYENQRSRYDAGRDAHSRPGRSWPAYDARFDPARQPPTGPRAERR